MQKKIKIAFIGSVLFSKNLLDSLIKIKFIEIAVVITKKRKKLKSDFCDLGKISKKHGLKTYYANNINSKQIFHILKEADVDYIFCFGWSQLLSKKILNTAKSFAVGYHPSDLPANRGRHPIIWALSLGLQKTASCFFKLNEKADDGLILSKKYVKISSKDKAKTLYAKLIKVAKSQIENLTLNLYKKNLKIIKVKKTKNNIWRKRDYNDGQIDWRMSAISINNLIKALSKPYDGAHFIHKNREFKVFDSKIIKFNKDNIEPGKILSVKRCNLIVKCGLQALLLKNFKSYKNFKNGEYLK